MSAAQGIAGTLHAERAPASKRIIVGYGFWIFLLSDIVMFSAFFATYAVLSGETAVGPSGKDLFRLHINAISTACLLLSSFTCGVASIGARARNNAMYYGAMVATAVLGGSFLVLEVREFAGMVAQGAGPTRSAFLSAFFTLVGCHGLHVSLGMLWLLAPRGFPARWLGLAGFLPLFAIGPDAPRAPQVWIDVLDVGQGLAVVVRTANHSLLYDTGPAYFSDSDSGSRIVVPFLRAAGIAHLDGVVVSHDDIDHSGGLLSVLQALPVDWVATSLTQSEPALALAARSQRCFAGQQWQWDGVRFEILHPTWESYNESTIKDNDRGCVLRVVGAAGTVLLAADIERQSEQQLLQRGSAQLPADVLIVPHHGSTTSSSDAFLDQVHPKIAIIPVGYRNRFGHPAAEVLARYQRLGARIFRTDRDGALLVHFDDVISVRAWRLERPRYWQGR